MKRIFLIACAAFALTGCTTISSLFAEADKEPTPIQQANAYVPAIRPVAADFCMRVGQSSRQDAMRAGFDLETQERMALRNSQQCQFFVSPQYASLQ